MFQLGKRGTFGTACESFGTACESTLLTSHRIYVASAWHGSAVIFRGGAFLFPFFGDM